MAGIGLMLSAYLGLSLAGVIDLGPISPAQLGLVLFTVPATLACRWALRRLGW